jgi:hypothetical protein
LRTPFIGQLEPARIVDHFIAWPPRGFRADRIEGDIPAFTCRFDLLTTTEPALRRRIEALPLYRHWQRWLAVRTRFIGSTVTEYAWFPMGADPRALARRIRRTEGADCRWLVVKDIAHASPLLGAADNGWSDAFAAACKASGFVLLEGQALAWVPIDFESVDDYVAALPRGRRRDLRRKLRSRAALDLAIVPAGSAFDDDAAVDELHALYRNVHAQGDVQFDFLERGFFAALLRDATIGGVVFMYRRSGRLIGWNLCFEHGGALVDKYMGLLYPDARENDLYAVSWVENLAYARRRGLHRYIAGWTDPAVKSHLGARFTFTRHAVYPRNALLRFALRWLARRFEGDRAWADGALPCDR